MSQPVKKVVIKRNRWSSPGPSGANKLYTVNGKKMCCLGFCAREAGFSVNEIKNVPDPGYLADPSRFQAAFPTFTDTVLYELMAINDDEDMTRAEREAALVEEAGRAGVKFVFVD